MAIGFPSTIGFKQLPAAITAQRLNAEGWNISLNEFAEGGLATQALAQNQVQLLSGSTSLPLLARQQGAHVKIVAEQSKPDFQMVAVEGIDNCADADGKRLGIHNASGDQTKIIQAWIATCSAKPTYLTIPGSDLRAAALTAGQLDLSAIDLDQWVLLDKSRPGQFHTIDSFVTVSNGLTIADWSVNTDWLDANRAVGVAFIAELLTTYRMIDADPSVLAQAAASRKLMDAAILPAAAQAFVDIKAFPVNGGVTDEIMQRTIDFYTGPNMLNPGTKLSDVFDGSVLNDALTIIGTLPT